MTLHLADGLYAVAADVDRSTEWEGVCRSQCAVFCIALVDDDHSTRNIGRVLAMAAFRNCPDAPVVCSFVRSLNDWRRHDLYEILVGYRRTPLTSIAPQSKPCSESNASQYTCTCC